MSLFISFRIRPPRTAAVDLISIISASSHEKPFAADHWSASRIYCLSRFVFLPPPHSVVRNGYKWICLERDNGSRQFKLGLKNCSEETLKVAAESWPAVRGWGGSLFIYLLFLSFFLSDKVAVRARRSPKGRSYRLLISTHLKVKWEPQVAQRTSERTAAEPPLLWNSCAQMVQGLQMQRRRDAPPPPERHKRQEDEN